MTLHPLRCETCKNKDCDYHYDLKCGLGCGYPIFWKFTSEKGCVSHSNVISDLDVSSGNTIIRLSRELRCDIIQPSAHKIRRQP